MNSDASVAIQEAFKRIYRFYSNTIPSIWRSFYTHSSQMCLDFPFFLQNFVGANILCDDINSVILHWCTDSSCLSISKKRSHSFWNIFAAETFGPVAITKALSDHSSAGRSCQQEDEIEDSNERIRTCSLQTDCGVTNHFISLPPTLILFVVTVSLSKQVLAVSCLNTQNNCYQWFKQFYLLR